MPFWVPSNTEGRHDEPPIATLRRHRKDMSRRSAIRQTDKVVPDRHGFSGVHVRNARRRSVRGWTVQQHQRTLTRTPTRAHGEPNAEDDQAAEADKRQAQPHARAPRSPGRLPLSCSHALHPVVWLRDRGWRSIVPGLQAIGQADGPK